MRYIVDTCVVSEAVRERPSSRVLDWLQSTPEEELALSVVTLGELRKGIARLPASRRRHALETWLAQDVRQRFSGRLLPITDDVALAWGELAGRAATAGRALAVLDGLIAATAQVHELVVVTRNVRDFQAAGVQVHDPWAP